MTRRADGSWEMTGREFKLLMTVLPLLTLIFAAGGAWGAVKVGLDNKLDKGEFVTFKTEVALAFQSGRTIDSLQIVASKELTDRVRQMNCGTRPACR